MNQVNALECVDTVESPKVFGPWQSSSVGGKNTIRKVTDTAKTKYSRPRLKTTNYPSFPPRPSIFLSHEFMYTY